MISKKALYYVTSLLVGILSTYSDAGALSLVFQSRSAPIQELSTMKDVLVPAASDANFKDALFALDSDNTILEASQLLGNEYWGTRYFGKISTDPEGAIRQQPWAEDLFKKYFKNEKPRPLTATEAFWVASDIFETVHAMGQTSKLVEPGTAVLLRRLQQPESVAKNIRLMVLTAARGSFLEKRTSELKRLGIDLDYHQGASVPWEGELTFAPGALGRLSSPRYRDGVFHTSYQDKGLMLVWFFLKMDFPKKVVFIDDSRALNEQVERALSDIPKAIETLRRDPMLGSAFAADLKNFDLTKVPDAIPHLCLRYSAADAMQFQVFDEIISLELSVFLETNGVISDEEASRLILERMEKAPAT